METIGKLRNRRDAAAFVRERFARPCSANLLDKMAVTGKGPAFRIIGGRFAVYEEKALVDWALADISDPVRSTSDAGTKRKPRGRKSETTEAA